MSSLTEEAVGGYAFRAGLRGEALALAIAISMPESSRDPSKHNTNASTGDNSYGLWQINMLGDLGPERRRQFGIARNDQLFDPATNAKAMYITSGGGSNWRPWTTFKNGAHRPYLASARIAARAVEARGGNVPGGSSSSSSSSSPAAGAGSADLGRSSDVLGGMPAGISGSYRASNMAQAFRVRGQLAARTILPDILLDGGGIDLSTDEVSEATLVVSVSGLYDYEVISLLGHETPLDWADLRLIVAGHEWGEGPGGMPALTVSARSAGAEWLRKPGLSLERSWDGMSPTEVAQLLAGEGSLRFVGEGSARRDQIVQAGAVTWGEATDEAKGTPETGWDLLQRLAKELGYWCFEAGNVLYFARPSWLVARMPTFKVHATSGLAAPSDRDPREDGLVGIPTCRRALDQDVPGHPPREVTLPMPRDRGEQVRPGMVCDFGGVAMFQGRYIVTRVSWALDGGDEPASVTIVDPKDPTPEPPEEELVGEDGLPVGTASATGAASSGGHGSALDMVTAALRQVGDEYVFGAEASASDADPDRFDCSELIEWACAQTGVTFVDGSSNQIAAIARAGLELPIAACLKIRGALLWHPGHVAISLGDGKTTVEAMGRAYGVVQGKSPGRFTRGGKIPGLSYGGVVRPTKVVL